MEHPYKILSYLLILLCIQWILPHISVSQRGSFLDKYYKRDGYKGWRYIVIHHSATDSGSAEAFHRYHTDKGYGGLCYHFVINNGNGNPDGKVEVGFRWKRQMAGTHCTVNAWDYNIFGIGICLVGNFEKNKPTDKQIESLVKLVSDLMKRHDIPLENVIGHKNVPYDDDPRKFEATVCPGKLFPMDKFKERLKKQVVINESLVLVEFTFL